MKRLAVFLMCMVVFGVAITLKAESKKSTPEKIQQPMLWKVTGNGLEKPSWLLGTIHVGDLRITGGNTNKNISTSQEINEAFSKADDVVVEIDISDFKTVKKLSTLSRLPNRKTLDDVVSPSTVELVKDALAVAFRNVSIYGNNPKVIDMLYKPLSRFKPIFLACSMQMMPKMMEKKRSSAFDLLICIRAKKNAKKLHSLETIKQQIDCFDIFSMADQEKILVATCQEIINCKKDDGMNGLIDAYTRGDVDEVNQIMQEQMIDGQKYVSKELLDKFYDTILDKRNGAMAMKIKEFLKENPDRSFLVAVGFAHMIGENGLLKMLRDAGYTVTRVKARKVEKKKDPVKKIAA